MVIPEIEDKRLEELAKRIKPVNRFIPRPWGAEIAEQDQCERQYLPRYYLTLKEGLDLRNQSFMWDAKPGKQATDLRELKRIITYHSFGSPDCFKPSIAEVLAAIPEQDLDRVVAFEVLFDSGNPIENVGTSVSDAVSYYRAITILFVEKT